MTMTPARERKGDTPENNFVEYVSEPASSSLEVSVNAKGLYQYTLKLYIPADADLLAQVNRVRAFDTHFRATFPTVQAGER